jgi:predicted Zn-dependent peptidase
MWNQDPAIIARRVDRINALTVASLKETFTKYFPAERMTVVTLMPAK